MPEQTERIAWPVWLLAAAALTAPVMAWHIRYFRSPGPVLYRAAIAGLLGLALAGVVWARLRRERWWRYEPALVAALPLLLSLFHSAAGVAVTALLFISCYAAGRQVRERMGLPAGSLPAEIGTSVAVGFGLLHVFLFTFGMAGILYWWVVLAVLLAPLLVLRPCDSVPKPLPNGRGSASHSEPRQPGSGRRFAQNLAVTGLVWRDVVEPLRGLAAGWARSPDLRSPLTGLLIPFAAVLALCTAAVALAPSIAFDSVTMHLPLAQYYAQEHALRPKPGLDYSFFPQSAELVFAAALMLGGQGAVQLVPPLFFVLSLLLLWAVLRECGATGAGAFCGIAFAASMPFLHWSGSVIKNDLQLAFFQLASLFAILRWRRSGSFRWACLAAVFAGCSFGVKHPAIFAGLPLGLFLLWAGCRQPRWFRALALLVLLAAAGCTIWYARTAALTGNPVYPLRAGESATPDHGVDQDIAHRIVRVAKLPFTVPFGGYYFFESPSPTPIGIALLMFWPVWLISGKPRPPEWVCLFFAVTAFFWWGWLSPMIRYIAAPLAVLAGLTGARAALLFDRWSGPARWVTGFAAVWCVAQGLCSLMLVEINSPQLRYLAGAIGRDEYLRAAAAPYGSLAYLARNTGPGDRILGVENCMSAYAPPPPRYYSVCGDTWTPDAIARLLRADRYTWLVAPAAHGAAAEEAIRACGRRGGQRYRDAAFLVYRLE